MLTKWIFTERQASLIEKAERIKETAYAHAEEADEKASFPDEVMDKIKEEQYPSLPLVQNLGGENITLYEFLLMQEKIAEGDGSVALSIGWHMGVMMELRDERPWQEERLDRLMKEVAGEQKVLNRIASEPATGSPTRGGMPETVARREENSYILNGRKTFASLADHLDYYLVSSYVEDIDTIGWFLIPKQTAGVSVEKTWDTLGMRGTESDDLLMEDVKIPVDALVETKSSKPPVPKGWLLHIPACYLGIAVGARNEAVEFAKNFQPNSLDTPISEVPHIQDKIGTMEWKLLQAHSFLYDTARKWDEYPERRNEWAEELGAVKLAVTNAAQEVVDLAMRITGGRGLSRRQPFEKYYRDVRAGLHNPPMDDAVISMLAKNV
ncbi:MULTISPECIES: acyl-CoA dehydrogenase family protein [Salimicrobium]|uniref:Acyl-CoA dehydrogenase n=1 Tax=Salimicrobium humidisoli TaxID=2029857 RepID=A0ABX4HSK4_9BACI|nr:MULTISPECIES: acyl-CoA dehydrogenase family protein [Salimicrobium]PBB06013.1 acyl-CoA dehydrogenase [Salimicrobium humidisoli]